MVFIIGKDPSGRAKCRSGKGCDCPGGKIPKGEWRVGISSGRFTYWYKLDCFLLGYGKALRTLIFEAMTDDQLKSIGLDVASTDESTARIMSHLAVGARVRLTHSASRHGSFNREGEYQIVRIQGMWYGVARLSGSPPWLHANADKGRGTPGEFWWYSAYDLELVT